MFCRSKEVDAGEERGPVNGMPLAGGDALQVLGLVSLELGEGISERAVAFGGEEGEKGDHETADEQADSVEGIGDGHRTHAAEDGVGRSHHSDEDDDGPDRLDLAPTEHSLKVKHSVQTLGSEEEHEGQKDQHVGDDEDEGGDGADPRSVALFQELRDGGNPGFEVAGKEEEGEE